MSADDAAAVFAGERARLVGLAYRLLGSLTDAEDVVQDAWFRWAAADRVAIERPAAWLTTVVSRLGLDRLRAQRRARIDYVGPWLPEPLVEAFDLGQPERAAVLADSLTTAFLVLLDRLGPEERLVLLLVDVFGEPFRVAAAAVGRSEEATRQLAVRARRKLRDRVVEHQGQARAAAPPSSGELLAIAAQFVGAVLAGDLPQVRSLLCDDAVLVSDGGPHRHAARRPVVGADRVARFVVNIGKRVDGRLDVDPVWVNGRPGALISLQGEPYMVTAIDVIDGRISRYWSFLNPDKLHAVGRSVAVL
jgi:RNA polymerase sigma-70 factor (ECF subfamily)